MSKNLPALKPSAKQLPLIISTGCPNGIGPEVSIAAAAGLPRFPKLLVGDLETLRRAAKVVGVDPDRLTLFDGKFHRRERIDVVAAGPRLLSADRRPGCPTKRSGAAQLEYVSKALELTHQWSGALVTGPVNKAAIAASGARGAAQFRGHTEWLQERDGATSSVMCFASSELVTSLATTHIPLAKVSSRLSPENVSEAIVQLAHLLFRLGRIKPQIAVCSLNPHAGEAELIGREEAKAVLPGVMLARRRLRSQAVVSGPIGAETAFRLALGGEYSGVVAMYHDQATIPMKLVAFGRAVNVTMGLSIVRTSVDHGTGYDIAWQGKADCRGMVAAMRMGSELGSSQSSRARQLRQTSRG